MVEVPVSESKAELQKVPSVRQGEQVKESLSQVLKKTIVFKKNTRRAWEIGIIISVYETTSTKILFVPTLWSEEVSNFLCWKFII